MAVTNIPTMCNCALLIFARKHFLNLSENRVQHYFQKVRSQKFQFPFNLTCASSVADDSYHWQCWLNYIGNTFTGIVPKYSTYTNFCQTRPRAFWHKIVLQLFSIKPQFRNKVFKIDETRLYYYIILTSSLCLTTSNQHWTELQQSSLHGRLLKVSHKIKALHKLKHELLQLT